MIFVTMNIPNKSAKTPAENLILRFQISNLFDVKTKGKLTSDDTKAIDRIRPTPKNKIYKILDEVESAVAKTININPALPASPWIIPIPKGR